MPEPSLVITSALVADLSVRAAAAPRRRLNHNLHPTLSDPVQRLLNAFEPGTYVRPHRHVQPQRWELFVALRGRALVLTFDPDGTVGERVELDAEGPALAVEIRGGVWHTVGSRAVGTVLLEVKPGPYAPLTDKDFAPWAPVEGTPLCAPLVGWFERARPGDPPGR
jgi:cupin fold WbuC family metalloprotein